MLVESGRDVGDILFSGLNDALLVNAVLFDLSGHEGADVGDLPEAEDQLYDLGIDFHWFRVDSINIINH